MRMTPSHVRRARDYIRGWSDAGEQELRRVTTLVNKVNPEDRKIAKRIASSLYNVLVHKIPTWAARLIALPFAVSLLAIASVQGRHLFGAAVMGQALKMNSWWIPTKFKRILRDSIYEIRTEASLMGALQKYLYLRGFDELEGGGNDIIIRSWGGYEYGDKLE